MPSLTAPRRTCYMAVEEDENEDGFVRIKIGRIIYSVEGFAWRKKFKGKRCVVAYRNLENDTQIIALLSLKGNVIVALDVEKDNEEANYFLKLSKARRGNEVFEDKVNRFFANKDTKQKPVDFNIDILNDPDETENEDIHVCVIN